MSALDHQILGLDVYQLTTLLAHAEAGRLRHAVAMSLFFRKLPHKRNYVVAAGLRAIVEHCRHLRLDHDELQTLRRHPLLGPALQSDVGRPVLEALAALDGFVGDIDALPEGTLAFAGAARDTAGQPVVVADAPLLAYTPLVQVRTELLYAKLLETPWLSRLNFQSMVASKAARIVTAARYDGKDRPVIEFGQRRTHPAAAVDVAYAAYLAGCAATSNLLATHRHGIPSVGTMDHFAIQAVEQAGRPRAATEAEFFGAFCRLFPHAATLLVDTYDTFRGIRGAVAGTGGALTAVRIDSQVTPDTIRRARALLGELGAPHVGIFVSDGLDEHRVRELAEAGADGFGVGENIACSPDAATGVGAVGKLVQNGYGQLTLKLARGSGKATLPGVLQAYRYGDHDLLALQDEGVPAGGQALLQPVWRGRDVVAAGLPELAASRRLVAQQLDALPQHLRQLPVSDRPWGLVLSDGLLQTVRRLAAQVES